MYDLYFENKLIEIGRNDFIMLDSHVAKVIKTIKDNRDSSKRIINTIYELSKEGYGIKLGNLQTYHIYKHRTRDILHIIFSNPIQQRFFDVSDFGEYFKGVIIENKDSEEMLSLNISNTNSSSEYEFSLEQSFVKGIQSPSNYYHSHRGDNQTCFGNILDGTLDSIKFSFAQTMNNLLEGLRNVNFGDTIAFPIHQVNELCFFGFRFVGSMENTNLRNRLRGHGIIMKGIVERMDRSFFEKIKKIHSITHSYHEDCYCYYCTSIHLIEMDRDRIVFDELSRVVVTRHEFMNMLNMNPEDTKKVMETIDTTKSTNFQSTIEIDANTPNDDDDESIDEFIYDNLNSLISNLVENNTYEVQECEGIDRTLAEINNEISSIRSNRNEQLQAMSDNKSLVKRMSSIEFLLGTEEERKEEDTTEIPYDEGEAKKNIQRLEATLGDLSEQFDEMNDELLNHAYYDLYQWTLGDYSDEDIREGNSDILWEMGVERYSSRDEDLIACDYQLSHINRGRNRNYEDFARALLPNSYGNYEHFEVSANGSLTQVLWRKKVDTQETIILDELKELYVRQHRAIDMKKIRSSVTTIIGCGTLGSNIAYTMSRLGYRIFGLIDYDIVSLNNLPNQFFKKSQVDSLKAESLKYNLLEILPSTTLPIIFNFDDKLEKYYLYNGDIPMLMNHKTDVFFLVTDNLDSRFNSIKWIEGLSKSHDKDYLVIDCRMNDLNKYVIYAYYIKDEDKHAKHLSTMVDSEGRLIQLEEEENACGFQSSILVAQRCSLAVIDILNKHHNNEEFPLLTTNEF